MTTINVCGVLVYAHPEYATEVRTKLEHKTGVEVHIMTRIVGLLSLWKRKLSKELATQLMEFRNWTT
jgi:nitrate reductase NapAB chaperone NapD